MWNFQLATRAGEPIGELRDARSRSLRFPLNRTPTVTFTVSATHPLAPTFLDVDKILVKAYDDSTGTKVLRFIGPVVGYEKTRDAQGGTMAITAAGVGWRLGFRFIGQAAIGATFSTNPTTLLDRGEIMGRTIDALLTGNNTDVICLAGDHGIRRGTILPSSQIYIDDWRFKKASDALADLSGTLDGPDYEITPVEPAADAYGVQLAELNISPAIGTIQPNVAFEFGTGHVNVADWKDIGDASTLGNLAFSLPPGFPDNATGLVRGQQDDTSVADRGTYETVVSSDLQTDELRLKLLQDTVRVRRTPRRTIAFTPVAEDSSLPISERRVPRLFFDYIVGDTVRFRAVERFPVYDTAGTVIDTTAITTVDALMRVFGAQIDLDDNGTASTALVLQNDL